MSEKKQEKEQEKEALKKSVVHVLFDPKKEFTIIGLTGRTGSGCSTVAKLLSKEKFEDFTAGYTLDSADSENISDNEKKKRLICLNYLERHWTPAVYIKITHLIILLCLKNTGINKFLEDVKKWITEKEDEKKGIIDYERKVAEAEKVEKAEAEKAKAKEAEAEKAKAAAETAKAEAEA